MDPSQLTDLEQEILDFIRSEKPCSRIEIINHFDPETKCNETDAILDHLEKSGVIRYRDHLNRSGPRLTGFGFHVLSSFKKSNEEIAAEEPMQKENDLKPQSDEVKPGKKGFFKVFFASVLIPVLVQHFDKIIDFLIKVIH